MGVRGRVRVRIRVRVKGRVKGSWGLALMSRGCPAPLTRTSTFLGAGPAWVAYSRCLRTRSHSGTTSAISGRKTVWIRGAPCSG